MMMRSVTSLLIVTLSLLAACADVPGESTTHQAVLAGNRLTANRLTANRLTANRLTANRLTANRLTANRLTVNLHDARSLLSTEGGRELFSFIVSCALPDDITLEATVDGMTFDFSGEIGLAREWMFAPLDAEGQGWVSACLFARVNANDVAIAISVRGPRKTLAVDDFEREGWPIEEGAFYGNFFVPVDQPIQWFACRGEGQASGEFGGLIDRDCTEPDPANPGLTQCGFNFAGDCGTFSAEPTCEQFSEAGQFYRRCHTAPIDDERHHGHGHHQHGGSYDADHVFEQVITTYVTP
jgi:hypothetical protein